MHALDIWLVVDEDGDYEVAKERDDALEYYSDNISCSHARRVVKLTVQVSGPDDATCSATVPAAKGEPVQASA